jgi:hypothetical protein
MQVSRFPPLDFVRLDNWGWQVRAPRIQAKLLVLTAAVFAQMTNLHVELKTMLPGEQLASPDQLQELFRAQHVGGGPAQQQPHEGEE